MKGDYLVMQILEKIVRNGETVGYMVDMGYGAAMPTEKRALYSEMYIRPLVESGYKYFDYDANNIEDANGNSISTHDSVDFDSVDMVEWSASVDEASNALSDAEASKYYTFKASNIYEFRKESSYQINTREELISYLERLESTFYGVSYVNDHRPINSFVNPEALFTIDELRKDRDVMRYFRIMNKRHKFRNFREYKELVDWLCEKGVLANSNPSMAEFLNAYYAWGPEGLKDKCTKVETKIAVDGMFMYNGDPLSEDPEGKGYYVACNRGKGIINAITDSSNRLYFLKEVVDTNNISTIFDFGRKRIAISGTNSLLAFRRMNFDGYEYAIVNGASYSDVSDRLYMSLMSEDNFMYTYKVAHNACMLILSTAGRGDNEFLFNNNFSIVSLMDSIHFPLDLIQSEKDYAIWNTAVIKAIQISNSKTVVAPYKSTTEYLMKDGINPIAAIDMAAHSIVKNEIGVAVNSRFEFNDKGSNLYNAIDLYNSDVPDYILKAFNLTADDIENSMETFIDLADVDDLRDRRAAMMRQELAPDQPGFDETFRDYMNKYDKARAELLKLQESLGTNKDDIHMDAIDYYTKVKFVYDCLHSGASVDYFGQGIIDDIGEDYLREVECIVSVIYAKYGKDVDANTAINAITNIDTSGLIDLSTLFESKNNADLGFKVDFAKYRKNRACDNAFVWTYCTRVFREISNAPVEKQRPYLMELVCLYNYDRGCAAWRKGDDNIRKLMHAVVEESIEKSDISDKPFSRWEPMSDWSMKKCAEGSIDYIAAKLFFMIIAGGVKSEPVDGKYIIPMEIHNGSVINVEVGTEVYDFLMTFDVNLHKRYITVYDYCKYEYNPNTDGAGTVNWCMVNVDVDPWHVRPKRGYSLKSYALLPNYYDDVALNNANGEGFYQIACENKEIVISPLINTFRDVSLLDIGRTEWQTDRIDQQNWELEDFLSSIGDPGFTEWIFSYTKRWALERKRAESLGKKLVSIPLKQDIVYASMAPAFCEEVPPTTAVYSDDASIDNKACQSVTTVHKTSWRDFIDNNTNLIDARQTTIREVNTDDYDINRIHENSDIIFGRYKAPVDIIVTGNYLNFMTESGLKRLAVSRLTSNDISQFAIDEIILPFGENKYYIHAINGDYILEV